MYIVILWADTILCGLLAEYGCKMHNKMII